MQIRITKAVLEYGPVQWTRGQIVDLPDELAAEFIARKEAVPVPIAEQATLPPPQNAVVPRSFSKPKPPAKAAAKARRR